ncbi:MAG: bifunctional methylenetetrahydrofolate dehydrogenase/methenyltetrahydrofolate cyclohydrolase FolD [Clostridia bacterium]|nr:bifunctional methylenetetrahydrofolate dehydrogenase/methenyltetrahydrofolate cyclohydrolase FolD [Clostridia bacterium]
MAVLLDGKAAALQVRKGLRPRVKALVEKGITPGLTVVLVGNNPASEIYVRNKEKGCEKVGIHSEVIRMKAETTQEELLAVIRRLNADPSVHGILVQLPLPGHLNEEEVLALIDPDKDVDGFHAMNAGRLLIGTPGFVSCTPKGVIELLHQYDVPLEGKNALVIGRSNIVGKPMAVLLLRENCTVTVAHSRTRNLKELCLQADIVVAAIGKAGFVTADMVKEGAVVVDVGINRTEDGKVVGDVDFENVEKKASYITPVPGGVGAMTIAMLLTNAVEAAERYGK